MLTRFFCISFLNLLIKMATFQGVLVRRVLHERRQYENNKDLYNREGIYISFSDDNCNLIKAMIIGTEDTPYQNGCYFFDIRLPEKYPTEPPHFYFQGTETKIHPIFNGNKVCLSVLGTWGGPQWDVMWNIVSILLAIQSMMSQNSLRIEPGYENVSLDKCQIFNEFVRYHNYKNLISTLHHLKKHKEFEADICKWFQDKKIIIQENLNVLKSKFQDVKIECPQPFRNQSVTCDYDTLYLDWNILMEWEIIN